MIRRIALLVTLALCCSVADAQVITLSSIGNTSSPISGLGAPSPYFTCTVALASGQPVLYFDRSSTVTSPRLWSCDNSTGAWAWENLNTGSTAWYSNGNLQANVKCDIVSGTTASNGTATVNIAGMGFTSILGVPQPSAQLTGTSPLTITASATTSAVNVYATLGTGITLLGINLLSFAAASVAYSVTVCGV